MTGALNQSLIDAMTEGITGRKVKTAGPSLTPVGTEASPIQPSRTGIPDVPEVFLTNEAIKDQALALRAIVGVLLDAAQGLDNLTKVDTAPAPVVADTTKAKEKAADKRAASTELTPEAQKLVDHMQSLKEKAKADTFTAADAPVLDHQSPPPEAGWACPTHGTELIESGLTSRRGRKYSACAVSGCEKFEK